VVDTGEVVVAGDIAEVAAAVVADTAAAGTAAVVGCTGCSHHHQGVASLYRVAHAFLGLRLRYSGLRCVRRSIRPGDTKEWLELQVRVQLLGALLGHLLVGPWVMTAQGRC